MEYDGQLSTYCTVGTAEQINNMRNITLIIKKALSSAKKSKIIFVISIIFVLGGAVNNGFSWFILAIPFVIIFIYQLRYYTKRQATLLGLTVTFASTLLGWNHSENIILYPYLNAKVTFTTKWGYIQYSDSKYYSLIQPKYVNLESDYYKRDQSGIYAKGLTLLEDNSVEMHLQKMIISYPEFETLLSPLFKDSNGILYTVHERDLLEGIREGTVRSNDLQGVENLQSKWTIYLGDLMFWPIFPLYVFSISYWWIKTSG